MNVTPSLSSHYPPYLSPSTPNLLPQASKGLGDIYWDANPTLDTVTRGTGSSLTDFPKDYQIEQLLKQAPAQATGTGAAPTRTVDLTPSPTSTGAAETRTRLRVNKAELGPSPDLIHRSPAPVPPFEPGPAARPPVHTSTTVETPATAGSGKSFPAAKALGVGAGVVFGGLQVKHGFEELNRGKVADGTTDIAVGGLNVAAGTTLLKGASKLAGPLGGAASVLDGGRDLYHAAESGDAKKGWIGAAKLAGGSLMTGAAFASGTLVGAPAGLVLGLAGGVLSGGATVVENWDGISQWVKSKF